MNFKTVLIIFFAVTFFMPALGMKKIVYSLTSVLRNNIFEATKKNDLETVMWHLNNGTSVNSTNWHGQTPLYIAIQNHRESIAQLLIAHGANVNSKCRKKANLLLQYYGVNEADLTLLYDAIEEGQVSIVQALIDGEALVNVSAPGACINCVASDTSSFTPLQWSCCHNSFEITEYLMTNGANVNTKDNNYLTPLHYACWTGIIWSCKIRLKTVQLLLENGANMYVKNLKDHTALDIAKLDKQNDPIIQLLIDEDHKRKHELLSFNTPRLILFAHRNPDSFSCTALIAMQRK